MGKHSLSPAHTHVPTYLGLFVEGKGIEGVRAKGVGKGRPRRATLGLGQEAVEARIELGLVGLGEKGWVGWMSTVGCVHKVCVWRPVLDIFPSLSKNTRRTALHTRSAMAVVAACMPRMPRRV